jgi:hypothetical protein
MRVVVFEFPGLKLEAELLDTPTADAIWKSLPIEVKVETWGEEVYFSTPVSVKRERGAREVIELGEIAYWTEGSAIAIGFGRTPASVKDEIRLASPVNIWAKARGDVKKLTAVKRGSKVVVRANRK